MYDLLYRHDSNVYRSQKLLEKYKEENIVLKKELEKYKEENIVLKKELVLLQNVRHHHKELGENQK